MIVSEIENVSMRVNQKQLDELEFKLYCLGYNSSGCTRIEDSYSGKYEYLCTLVDSDGTAWYSLRTSSCIHKFNRKYIDVYNEELFIETAKSAIEQLNCKKSLIKYNEWLLRRINEDIKSVQETVMWMGLDSLVNEYLMSKYKKTNNE